MAQYKCSSTPSPLINQVGLRDQQSALALLHTLLLRACREFPETFGGLALPLELEIFRHNYVDLLPEFEARRLLSNERSEVARFLSLGMQAQVVWHQDEQQTDLSAVLECPATPCDFETHQWQGSPGWVPELEYANQAWRGTEIARLGCDLAHRGMISQGAADSLAQICGDMPGAGINLTQRHIVVLGAGAEMAPTYAWLAAGANVLWLDKSSPPTEWLSDPNLRGKLSTPASGCDLLGNPQAARDSIVEFAAGNAVDIGLFAYAPGRARELLLTATMNAIVESLPAEIIASVTMLVSPTTPTGLDLSDLGHVEQRIQHLPGWARVCQWLGLLNRGGGVCFAPQDTRLQKGVTQSVVAIQGASYQAAQYLGKIMTAERWAKYGLANSASAQGLRVSANTAAITSTSSLSHPVFDAAFLGAAAFGVETLNPHQSRQLNGLLAVSDWLSGELPSPGHVRVHGGIHTLAFRLDSALRIAAVFGILRRPNLLLGLFRR